MSSWKDTPTLHDAARQLRKVEANISSDDAWLEATEVSLGWLLEQRSRHWYCPTGATAEDEEDRREVMIFVLRLLAYKAKEGDLLTFRNRLSECLDTCIDCVDGFLQAKSDYESRWLIYAKTQKAIDGFVEGFAQRETERLIKLCDELGINADGSTSKLSKLPPPVLHYILSSRDLFTSEYISARLANASRAEPAPIAGLPEFASAGLLAYAIHASPALRAFAHTHLHLCKPISLVQLKQSSRSYFVDHLLKPQAEGARRLSIVEDPVVLWEALTDVVGALSATALTYAIDAGKGKATENAPPTSLPRYICTHLGDRGATAFLPLLKLWTKVLERCGEGMWADQDKDYAGVVLSAVLDNPAFEASFVGEDAMAVDGAGLKPPDPALFAWQLPFLRSVATSQSVFPTSLGNIAIVLLDRLQKIRFTDQQRAAAAVACIDTFARVFVDDPDTWPHLDAARQQVLDIYALPLANLAFDKATTKAEGPMLEAAEKAAKFLRDVSEAESVRVREAMIALVAVKKPVAAAVSKSVDSPEVPIPVKTQPMVWKRIYEAIKATKTKRGYSVLLRALQPVAHLEMQLNDRWMPLPDDKLKKDEAARRAFYKRHPLRAPLEAINDFFKQCRRPLADCLNDLADGDLASVMSFIVQPGVIGALVALITSPDEELHHAALNLIRTAFDVTSRTDCFRSLLQNSPKETMQAILAATDAFNSSAAILPEACGSAKRIVRCLTDILDVLCDAGHGLLRDDGWIRANRMRQSIAKLWLAICEAMALIFTRTQHWAPFFVNAEMTDWMRDAVLFGTDLVDQVRTFEAVAMGNGKSNGESSRGSGDELVEALNPPFDGLINWIRINDADLVAISAALITKMIDRFVRSRVPVSQAVIKRLIKYASGEKHASTMLPPAELKGFCIALSQHRAHRDAFKDVEGVGSGMVGDGKAAQAEWWRQHVGEGKGKTVVEISDDEAPAKRADSKPSKLTPAVKPVNKSSYLDSKVTATLSNKSKIPPTTLPKKPVAGAKPSAARPSAKSSVKPVNFSHALVEKQRNQLNSDSSDSDDNPRERTLADLGNMQRSPGKQSRTTTGPRFAQERDAKRATQHLDVVDTRGRGATRGIRGPQVINEAATRVRIKPDFTDLHRTILQWDYLAAEPLLGRPRINEIPATFRTAHDYIDTLQPLLMWECWQQVMRAKEDTQTFENSPISCTVAGRQSVDDFVEVFLVAQELPEKMILTESDLAVISVGHRTILAKIQGVSRKRDSIDITVRCHFGIDPHGASSGIVSKARVELLKLFSLSTTHREYAALMAMPYLSMTADILEPDLAAAKHSDPSHIKKVMQAHRVNEPQAQAILGVLETRGFSLIQGPPGTGKTSTILGLVGAFISRKASNDAAGHLLLCAPSNAAVDELVKRLKEGVRKSDGSAYVPKVVRIGAEAAVNIGVRDVFVDELVEVKLNGVTGAGDRSAGAAAIQRIRGEIDGLRKDRDAKFIEKEGVQNNAALVSKLDVEIRGIRSRINQLNNEITAEMDKQKDSGKAMDRARREARLEVLTTADVICSTLSGSGHDYMTQLPFDFETVIIDEAAQSIELSSLIPLKYGCRRCIMVGDPNQLPPTVLSQVASDAGYNQSLFVRMLRQNDKALHLLSIQYRMHPQISTFPSNEFYGGRLRDGADMATKTAQPWHANALFPPYSFMHVVGGSEQAQARGHSLSNPLEATMAVLLYDTLLKNFPQVDFSGRVGIITTYRGQLFELKKQFRQRFGDGIIADVDFNTVDGFQGQEKDIIILSCVRGQPNDTKGSIGFLSDPRRMNVALTRPRSSMFILGNASALEKNKLWGALIADARSRGCFREVDRSTFQRMAAIPAAPVSPTRKTKPKAAVKAPAALAGLMTPKEMSQGSSSPKKRTPVQAVPLKRRLSTAASLEEASGVSATQTAVPSKKARVSAGDADKPDFTVDVPSPLKRPPPSNPHPPAKRPAPGPPPRRPGPGPPPARAPTQAAAELPSLFVPRKPPTVAGRGRGR